MLQQLLVLVIILLLSQTTTNADVGKVTQQTGPTEIKRNNNFLPSSISSGIEMNDVITTANSRTNITFKDDTKVEITEQSKLVIDNFVYDDTKKTGKLAIKMALGTIKYASGQIAKNDPQQINIETPTATIGVRGTDFSGTVDEIGKSTVILLPSCPAGWKNIDRDCKVGKIIITTDVGTIQLTKAFESVTIDTKVTPLKSSILNLSLDQINNLIIVTPPKQVQQVEKIAEKKTFNYLDNDFLTRDLLKYDELNKNKLEEFDQLKRNFLDVNLLYDFLSVVDSQLLANELADTNALLPKYNAASGLKYYVQNEMVTLYREVPTAYFELRTSTFSNATVNLTQEGLTVKQVINNPGTTTITIKQSQ